MSHLLRIQLLGRFQIHFDGSAIKDFESSHRLQSLLALLVLNNDIPQPRAYVANLFWPASSTSQARTNLRKLLHQLNRFLPNEEKYLILNKSSIQWNPNSDFSVDIFELWQHLDIVKRNPFELRLLTEAAANYTDKLLPKISDEWIQPIRFSLHEKMIHLLERLVRLFTYRKEYSQAIIYAQRLVVLEPTNESYYCQLMHLYSRAGNKSKALETYQKCFSTLQRELHLQPKPKTQALFQEILRPTHSFTQDLSTETSKEQLPLVSRQAELKYMQKLVAQMVNGRTQCLLIEGETGIGKTRLAQELLDYAYQQGIVVAQSQASNLHHNLALSGAAQLFCTPEISKRLGKIGPFWFREIIRLFPELLDNYPNVPYETKNSFAENRSQRLLFESMARGILIDNQPTILFLDDLQWVDSETLNWLCYLLLYQRNAKLLVLGTNSIDSAINHTLEKFRHNVKRQDLLNQITLSSLDQVGTTTLANLVSKKSLSQEQQKSIYQLTMGNPGAVIERLRATVNSFAAPLKPISFGQTVA